MKIQTQHFMVVKFRMICTLMLFLVCAGFAFQFPLFPAIAEKSPDEILAGVHRNFPPQYSIDEKTGKPTGFAIDIMDEVARRAGLKIRYVIFDEWPPIAQALKAGQIDILPNIAIVEERRKDMDFTSPVLTIDIRIFIRETTADINSIDDLQGRNVAVVRDNMGLSVIQEYGKAKPTIFNSLEQALLSLLSGNTDALVYPEPAVVLVASKSNLSERVKTVGTSLLEVKRAIAVGKGKTDLLNKLDIAVKELIPTQEYKEIYARWYVSPAPYWDVRHVLTLAGAVLVFVIIIFAVWYYLSLRRLNRYLKYALEEQKKSEEAVRDNEVRLKVALTPIDMAVFHQDLDLRYTWLYRPQLGYTTEQVIGKTDADLLPPDAARKATEIKRRVLEYGASARGEVEVALQDRTIYYDLIVEPLRNVAGQVVGITGASLDITDRKQAEAALKKSEKKFRELVENINDVPYELDEQGILQYVGPSVEHLLGYCQAEIIGRPINDFLHPDDVLPAVKNISRSMEGNIAPREYRIRAKWLEPRWIRVFSSPLMKGDKIVGIRGVLSDITSRKQAEEKIQASLREKDTLISEIHHRVKNNLQVISGLLYLQAKGSKNPELTESFRKSQDRIRAMALVHEKLYNSKDFSRIDLADYVRSLSEESFQSCNIHPGKIDLTIQTGGEVFVNISKAIPCGLILNELISNALKHAFPGDKQGKLHITISETKSKEIEIVVRDNGEGLPVDVDIHEPQSLGLDLVNGLLTNQLDGQIEVKRDNGTEFRITFPL